MSFDGQGAVCGVCGERVVKGLSGKGLRHVVVVPYPDLPTPTPRYG